MNKRKFQVDRSLQNIFCHLVLVGDMDGYGYCTDENKKHRNIRGGYENETFAINPFWWGEDDNLKEVNKPNFLYKPTGLEIEWYKYPLRSAYMNQNLSRDELILVFAKCYESINKDKDGENNG